MYKEYDSPDITSDFLDKIWFSDHKSKTKLILPDNCTDIIIPLNGDREPYFVGPMTTFITHNSGPDERLLGLRFKPGCSAALIREDISCLADRSVDLSAVRKLSCEPIIDHLDKSRTIPYEFISGLLLSLFSDFTQDSHVAESISLLKQTAGNIRIEELARRIGISRRMLEKKFKRCLGKTPKRFAQIERFNYLVHDGGGIFDTGYTDQSHMIKEFKMLSGLTPTEYFS